MRKEEPISGDVLTNAKFKPWYEKRQPISKFHKIRKTANQKWPNTRYKTLHHSGLHNCPPSPWYLINLYLLLFFISVNSFTKLHSLNPWHYPLLCLGGMKHREPGIVKNQKWVF
jgi:hypothetical protein